MYTCARMHSPQITNYDKWTDFERITKEYAKHSLGIVCILVQYVFFKYR